MKKIGNYRTVGRSGTDEGVNVRRKVQKLYPFKKSICEDKCFVLYVSRQGKLQNK